MYILLNRENTVIDILSEVRYIKLQSSNGIVVACEEDEGTGVIGSDCDTHYTLIKADTLNSSNAVKVLEIEEIPSDVVPKYSVYNAETGEFTTDLAKAQYDKQEENKLLFAEYLATHPLTWVDGKEYGVTQEDQSEISLNINQYQVAVAAGIKTPTLEWHARHEECTPWSLEQLSALSLAISEVVYPKYRLMQEYKVQIYGTTSIAQLKAINLVFEDNTEDEVSETE